MRWFSYLLPVLATLWAVASCASITSVSPSQATLVGGTPVTLTGSGFVNGMNCYWPATGGFTTACVASSTSAICLSPSVTSAGSSSVAVYISGAYSAGIGFTFSSAASNPTYSDSLVLRISSANYVVPTGTSVSVNISLSAPLPCRAVQFALSHPYGTFDVPAVTFNVGQNLKTVNLLMTAPGSAVPTISPQSSIEPFTFQSSFREIVSYVKYISVTSGTPFINQGSSATVTLTLSNVHPTTFNVVPSGNFIFSPPTVTFAANTLTATLNVKATAAGEQVLYLNPAVSDFQAAQYSFSVDAKTVMLSLPTRTLLIGDPQTLSITLSAPSSTAFTMSLLCSYCGASSTSISFAAGATSAAVVLRPWYPSHESISVTSPLSEYASTSISVHYVQKSVKVLNVPSSALVGDTYTLNLTTSAVPSTSLVITPASSPCYLFAGAVTIQPPASWATVSITATCETSSDVSFTSSLTSEFVVLPSPFPSPFQKSILTAVTSSMNVGATTSLSVTLSASPSTTLILTPSDSFNVLTFSPASVSISPGQTTTSFTVTATGPGTTTITLSPSLPSEFEYGYATITCRQKRITLALSSNNVKVATPITLNVTLSATPSSGFTLTPSDSLGAIITPASAVFSSSVLFQQFTIKPTSSGTHDITFSTIPYSQEFASTDIRYLGLLKLTTTSQSSFFLRPSATVIFTLSNTPSSDMTISLFCSNCQIVTPSVIIPTTGSSIAVTVSQENPGPAWLSASHNLPAEFQPFPTVYFDDA